MAPLRRPWLRRLTILTGGAPTVGFGDVVVRPSQIAGIGVFAARAFTVGEVIERCPLLLLDGSAWRSSAVLYDHVVTISARPLRVALPLGYGALYNHADAPNANWSVDASAATMDVTADRYISPDEEISIHYGTEFVALQKTRAAGEGSRP